MKDSPTLIKQFPDLFSGKKILYCHGFASSGQSGTVTRMRTVLPGATVVAPDLPVHPEEAIALLRQVCQNEQPDLVIGTSMGAMYAEMLYGHDRILINPALQMGDTMKEHGMTGTQHFQNPRLDGATEFIVTKAMVKEYKDMTEQCFAGITPEEQRRVWGLFGDEDATVHTFPLFTEHYTQAIHFHGEHRMNDQAFMHAVVPVIRWIDDRQEGRERPIVYIDVNTLIDKWEKPQSASQKTIRTLLERYQLFFVAPAAAYHPSESGAAPANAGNYAAILSWLYQYVNVPAYGHTIFTNQKHLLYGDYLIDADKTEGMATLIQFGTDTFKSWEDVAEYFSRLGGQ